MMIFKGDIAFESYAEKVTVSTKCAEVRRDWITLPQIPVSS